MDGIDLSVPFRKTVAKVVQVGAAGVGGVGGAAAPAGGATAGGANWRMYLLVGGVLLLLYYLYSQSKKKEAFQSPQQQSSSPQPQSRVDQIKLADAAFVKFTHNSRESDYDSAITLYTDALSSDSTTTPEQLGYVMNQLATLYHQGCPQSDGLGGVPPNAEDAIHFYRQAIKYGYHGAVLPLASIYHWGLTGFEGNREVAKHLYGVVLKTGTEYEKGLAKDRLRQMREETGQSVGSSMLEEESNVTSGFSTQNFGADPYAESFMDIDKSPYSIGKDEITRGIDEKYVDDLIQNKLGIRGARSRLDQPKTKAGVGIAKSDPQNARDHVVVNSAKQSLERLRANTHIQYDIPTTFKMINEYIQKKSDVSQRKRELATQVLMELSKGIANLGYEQSKEIEALHLVWNRIHSQIYAQSPDKRHSLMENLVNELAECIEYGELVCPTGRLNRIIDVLNQLDPVVNIQPKWAVQQAMVARAGVIQKSLLEKANAETRAAMEAQNPNARQRQLQEEFEQRSRKTIERDLTQRYVDTGMMSKALLKTELDSWMI